MCHRIRGPDLREARAEAIIRRHCKPRSCEYGCPSKISLTCSSGNYFLMSAHRPCCPSRCCCLSLHVALSLWTVTSVQDADRNGADLSGLSYAEAVEYLREQATILDYKTLGRKGQDTLNAATPGIVPGVSFSLPSLQPLCAGHVGC